MGKKRYFNVFALQAMLLAGTIITGSKPVSAQQKDTVAVPIYRMVFHDRVTLQQEQIDLLDGKKDRFLAATRQAGQDRLISQALFGEIDELKMKIEKDSRIPGDQDKKRALVAMETLLKNYILQYKKQTLNVASTPLLVSRFGEALQLAIARQPLARFIDGLPYETGFAIYEALADYSQSIKGVKEMLVLKYCRLHPDRTFITLSRNPEMPFVDSLIKAAGKLYPEQLYTYAQANNKLGYRIRNIQDDSFVRSVVKIAGRKSGQQYFPFLDNIVNGRLSMEDIGAVMNDSVKYYRLLVKTQIEYTERAMRKDTPIGFRELTRRLETKAKDIFVTTINGLHEQPDQVRFRCIQPLTAEELYYLAVMSNGLIYTSSYTNGVYPLMMKKANNRGDSLLMRVHFDHYRRFISQAAAYNKLGPFLASFSNQEDAHKLMQTFVNNLESSPGLEDGVDVADSYASIVETLKPLADEMLQHVKENYERNVKSGNKKGIAVYNILYKLFLSADSANRIDLTRELGIPPVYNVPYASLANNKDEVVMQVFFYGDEDGRTDFNIFQQMFNNSSWKIDRTRKQWIVVRSAKGKPVTLYANIPFREETGEDDKAQQALGEYLQQSNIRPTVTINRGHSYHAETTIAYMSPSSRIVFMGSCGGFNLIDAILRKSPDAHIIASKQIGKRDINKPFMLLLTEQLRNGKDIDWIPFWREFAQQARVTGFEDYIPPYKNLGAIFIKAYKQAMGDPDQ